jgi:hypothetical protein
MHHELAVVLCSAIIRYNPKSSVDQLCLVLNAESYEEVKRKIHDVFSGAPSMRALSHRMPALDGTSYYSCGVQDRDQRNVVIYSNPL